MWFIKKLSWSCLNQMILLLLLTPALCNIAFITVLLELTSTTNLRTFNFNTTNYIKFYNCLVTRYDNCLINYELSVNNVTGIVESGSSNISALPVYTCKNNQSTNSIRCSREDQCNCTFTSYDFTIVWNYAAEYFSHPYLNNKTITCVNRSYTFYFNKSDVSTTTEWTNFQSTSLNLPSTLTTILKSTFSTTNNYVSTVESKESTISTTNNYVSTVESKESTLSTTYNYVPTVKSKESTFSTTNNFSSTFESKASKLPIILGTIGGVVCLVFIIATTVIVIRRVQQNRMLLKSDNTSLTKRNPQNDTVPTNTIYGDPVRITPNDTVTITPNIFRQITNDTLGHGFKYFNTIVEDDYICIDDNKHNSHVISTAAVSATIHPETSDAIDSLKTDYTDIKITKDKNVVTSTNKTETRNTNYYDGYNFISDTKNDYSRLGKDIRDVNNPYDGLLELKEEQSLVHQQELYPYTLAKPIPGAATLEIIDVGVFNDNLQPLTAASKHSVNTHHNYDTPPNTGIKRNAFGYTEVKKKTF